MDAPPLIHRLTAYWSEVETKYSGWKVQCALAVNGITQWQKSATLTVAPATTSRTISASPALSSPHDDPSLVDQGLNTGSDKGASGGLSTGGIVGISVGVTLMVSVVAVTIVVVILVLVSRRRHSRLEKLPITADDDSHKTLRNIYSSN